MFPNSLLSRLRKKIILSAIITVILTYRLFVEGSVREQWEVIFRKIDGDGFQHIRKSTLNRTFGFKNDTIYFLVTIVFLFNISKNMKQ